MFIACLCILYIYFKAAAREAFWNQSNEDTLLFTAVFAFEPGTGVCTYLITQASLSDSSLGVHSGSALAESTRSPFNEICQPLINDTTHRKQMEISKVPIHFLQRMESYHRKLYRQSKTRTEIHEGGLQQSSGFAWAMPGGTTVAVN